MNNNVDMFHKIKGREFRSLPLFFKQTGFDLWILLQLRKRRIQKEILEQEANLKIFFLS
jgi:hypothetical protein